MEKPDNLEQVMRFGCGAVVGLAVGPMIVVGTASLYLNSAIAMGAVVVLSAVICGFLGWRFGDRFFHSLHKWIRWL